MTTLTRQIYPNTNTSVVYFTERFLAGNFSELGRKLGVSRQRAAQLKDDGIITIILLNKFCNACNISISDFFNYAIDGEVEELSPYIEVTPEKLTAILNAFLDRNLQVDDNCEFIVKHTELQKTVVANILKRTSIVGFYSVLKLVFTDYDLHFIMLLKTIERGETYKW